MSWTDERVETLKKMWAEGQSASQIAKELGGVTRNAVIGKVHRLGLSNRAGPGGKEDGEEDEVLVAPLRVEPAAPERSAVVDPVRPVDPPRPGTDRPLTDHPVADRPVTDRPVADRPVTGASVAEGPLPGTGATGGTVTTLPVRKLIIPAGQPLPPQPSANEISPEALASVREVEKRAKRLTLMELTERTCKWPIGDPATEDFWFCGLPSLPGKPYCEAHVGVAFQPMSARRDRRR